MLNLFDVYDEKTKDLHYSLKESRYNNPTVVINDDGFLPEDVESPFKYFVKENGKYLTKGKPLFFNEVLVPKFWQIQGDGTKAEVLNLGKERARIVYTGNNKRTVKEVHWLDLSGNVRLIERYNRYGWKFAQTILNISGEWITTSYFTSDSKEVIVENHVTGDIILQDKNNVKNFKNRTDFTKYFIEKAGYYADKILFNSLSIPLFVTMNLPQAKNCILFWQEDIDSEIPGNMKMILDGSISNVSKIVVLDEEVYARIKDLVSETDLEKITSNGYIYPFKRKNKGRKVALTMTNSDQIEQLETLVQKLPNIEFNIAALTEMSPKLLSINKYENVVLYPSVNQARIDLLWQAADIYLDINHQNEILDASRNAFENNMVILAFENTLHNRQFVAKENIFAATKVNEMIKKLDTISLSQNQLEKALKKQHRNSNQKIAEKYHEIIG